MDYFKEEISSSGKPYYRNKITNETQWGFKTYHKTKKPLPKGWVRLNLDGKPFYKYISNKKELTNYYSSYAYSPTELEEISPNQRAATLEYTTETTVPSSSIKSVRDIPTLRDVFRHQITGLRYNEKEPDILMPPSREPALNFKVNPIEQEKVERKLIEDAKKIEEERNVMLHKRIVRKRIAEENKRIADLDAQKINLLQEQIKLLQDQLKVAQEEITGNKKVREQELNMILVKYKQDIGLVSTESSGMSLGTIRHGLGQNNYQTLNLLIEELLHPLKKGTKRVVGPTFARSGGTDAYWVYLAAVGEERGIKTITLS